MTHNQLAFDLHVANSSIPSAKITDAINALANKGGLEIRGAVFTRPEVVEFILDLAGYKADQPLYKKRVLEPSFGGGDFLLPTVGRLLDSWRMAHRPGPITEVLRDAICAVELHRATFASTHAALVSYLEGEGIDQASATKLAGHWLVQADFLLTPITGTFDFIVGNPPYVRQELIPNELLKDYRARYRTMYDRADLYVPFFERSLRLLAEHGTIGFICADRWMKNRYGGPLRKLVADLFHLRVYVDMVDTPAFQSEVSAYPAITVIGREKSGPTRVAYRPSIETKALGVLARELTAKRLEKNSTDVREMAGILNGDEPWLFDSTDQLALVRRLEERYPILADGGCKVGIGVATGADEAFIGDFEALDVESDRKVRLATTRDIENGEIRWQGKGVINPFADGGGLVDLADYPRLRAFLEERKDLIANRHCAKKNLAQWYRTIDRITPSLTSVPKLLIPDIKGSAHVVFDPGELYPHHNLYFTTSETWDLRALQAVLLSSVARLFVASYSTRMRGGYLRFQAQYLRRIRIPLWADVSVNLRMRLIDAATSRSLEACNEAAFELYDLRPDERALIGGNGFTDAPGPS